MAIKDIVLQIQTAVTGLTADINGFIQGSTDQTAQIAQLNATIQADEAVSADLKAQVQKLTDDNAVLQTQLPDQTDMDNLQTAANALTALDNENPPV